MTERLHLGDVEMVENHVDDLDLVWGMKVWRERDKPSGDLPIVMWEMRYRVPGHDTPVYIREKLIGDPEAADTPEYMTVFPTVMQRIARLLTDEAYRLEILRSFHQSKEN